ncbi:hypothetical protein EZV62_005275 [Acer yangbiense]|uniref:ABC transporter domain-containing protein n=1 Tax=Acer yangbiense TaxID=1000413 RepID=A0A5C7IMC4_9ROSI|nr:hypothetical protein EZV62_005275 [Acer yangbiense]
MEYQSKESGTSDNGVYLVWEDLTVVAQSLKIGATKKLVSGLSGYAESDRIMAIMGPSGSGKSTLLDALAGRLSTNTLMTGNILLNGKKAPIDSRDVSYVTQDDYFFGTLSVREILTYSAHLRLPSKMTNDEIDEIVQETIVKMGLQDCAENKIGNWHLRGISTGEKRRVSIGVEILTQPKVLFLDEPTSGLDSASAFFVLLVLNSIAHDGRIVVCSVHQPSSFLFDLFDDLLLLSNGETIYFGDAKLAVKFFAEAGFPCPTRRNPSDHFLCCINSDFDKISASPLPSQRQSVSTQTEVIPTSSNSQIKLTTKEIKEKLVKKYKDSDISKSIRKRIQELALSEQVEIVSNKSNAGWWKQLWTLSGRSFLNMSRDMGYYWLRTLFYILVSVSAGNLYFNIGLSYQSIVQRAKCDAFVYGFMICLSIGGLSFFLEEFKVKKNILIRSLSQFLTGLKVLSVLQKVLLDMCCFVVEASNVNLHQKKQKQVSNRERISGHYGEGVFVLSNFLSSFPFLVVLSTSSGTIIYYMVKLHPGILRHAYFCINLFCCISIVETCIMVVALLVPNVLMGMGVGTCVVILMMMASEIFKPDLPKFFWRYPMSYISFASWAIQGQYKNDMIGLEFDPQMPGDTKLMGEEVLQKIFGMELELSKWWDLFALLVLLVSYRLILLAVLKYKEKSLSLLRRLYAGITFRQPVKQLMLMEEKFMSSKTNQPTQLPSQPLP